MPLDLLPIIGCAPGDVMHRTYRYSAYGPVGSADHINEGAGVAGPDRITKAIPFLSNQSESKGIGEKRCGPLVSFFRQRGAVKAMNGILHGNGAGLPALLRTQGVSRDKLKPQS